MVTLAAYIGAVVAIIIFCTLIGILARRRARTRYTNFAVPPPIPTYPHPPIQPSQNFGQNPYIPYTPQPWMSPPPTFPSPTLPRSQSLSYPPLPAAYAHGPDPSTPSSPNFSLPPPTQPTQAPHLISQPTPTPFPPPIGEKEVPLAQGGLMDRMREVQTSMAEIHRLESGPGPDNRERIQELQRRVTELSDTQNSNVTTPGQALGPPPAYVQDGRD